MSFAPIVLFTYSRLKNTRETVESLLKNHETAETDLFVYSDAAKNESAKDKVAEVRQYIHSISGFKTVTIIERDKNWGLAKNIIAGVTEIVNKYGRVIVLEDDHSVAPFFLQYMNEALNRYEDNKDIVSIHGYVYPHKEKLPETFLIKGADCWSWATWKDAWDLFNPDAASLYKQIIKKKRQREFEFNFSYPYMDMLKLQAEGKANSWAICWYASTFLLNKYTMYPGASMMSLNSLEDGGTHSDNSSPYLLKYAVTTSTSPIDLDKAIISGECLEARKAFESFFDNLRNGKGRIKALIKALLRIVN